jgi:hypothetical protein
MKLGIGLLRITRRKEYFGIIRSLLVYLNGEKVAGIGFDNSIQLELCPAEYELEVRMDWCSSQPFVFHLFEGQTLRLEASVNGGAFGYLFHSPTKLFLLTPITDKSKRKNEEQF